MPPPSRRSSASGRACRCLSPTLWAISAARMRRATGQASGPRLPLLCAVADLSADDPAHARPALLAHHRLRRLGRLLHALSCPDAGLDAQRLGGPARMAVGLALKSPSRAGIDPVRGSLRTTDLVDALARREWTFGNIRSTNPEMRERIGVGVTSDLQRPRVAIQCCLEPARARRLRQSLSFYANGRRHQKLVEFGRLVRFLLIPIEPGAVPCSEKRDPRWTKNRSGLKHAIAASLC